MDRQVDAVVAAARNLSPKMERWYREQGGHRAGGVLFIIHSNGSRGSRIGTPFEEKLRKYTQLACAQARAVEAGPINSFVAEGVSGGAIYLLDRVWSFSGWDVPGNIAFLLAALLQAEVCHEGHVEGVIEKHPNGLRQKFPSVQQDIWRLIAYLR